MDAQFVINQDSVEFERVRADMDVDDRLPSPPPSRPLPADKAALHPANTRLNTDRERRHTYFGLYDGEEAKDLRAMHATASSANMRRKELARHDSAEDFCRLKARRCTAMDWIFILAYCFAIP